MLTSPLPVVSGVAIGAATAIAVSKQTIQVLANCIVVIVKRRTCSWLNEKSLKKIRDEIGNGYRRKETEMLLEEERY